MNPISLICSILLVAQGASSTARASEEDRLRAMLGLPPERVAPSATPAQVAAETERVRRFVGAIELDRNGRSILRSPSASDLVPGKGWRGTRHYLYRGLGIAVDPTTGLVVGFYNGANQRPERPKHPSLDTEGRVRLVYAPREVSDEEAGAIAARAYAATGRAYGIWASFVDDGTPGFFPDLHVGFQPTYRGVPFSDRYRGYVLVDRETGELGGLEIRGEPPAPPASVVPGVSADHAHLVALRAAALAGVAVRDYAKPYNLLSIALLDPKPRPDSTYGFTATDTEDAHKVRSRLVYDIRLEGKQGATYTALVDALDGHLLQVRRDVLYVGGPPKDGKIDALAPPAEPRPWRVAEGDAPWGAPVMSVLEPAPAGAFKPGGRLLLTDGKLAFQAAYDPESELLGIEEADGTFKTYRPGPALAALLRRRTKG